MKYLMLLLVCFSVSGCFEEGTIDVKPDRINVSIKQDGQSFIDSLGSFFLKAERGLDGYFFEGYGRNVYFDSTGLIPVDCTPEFNCYTYTPRPAVSDLHSYAARPLRVNIWSVDGVSRENHSEIKWIRSDLERLGFNVELAFQGVTPSERLYVDLQSLDHKGNIVAGYSEISQYRTSDIPYWTAVSHSANRDLCENWALDEQYYFNSKAAPIIGNFKADALAKIVHFHIDNERANCPTVDPIEWAFDGTCI
ncbi:MAG: hypothetical protein AB8B86_11565 [Pseudomonadales bacterium]